MKKLKYLFVVAATLFVFYAPAISSADVNNFTITSLNSDETLSANNPQGELHITERINVDFTDQNHGLLRAIPKSYKGQSLDLKVLGVSSDSGAPNGFTTYTSNGNEVLQIGDPNRTVTGPQEYTINYTVDHVISFYKDHDELYWNVNGNQWQQVFDKVTDNLHLPEGLVQNRQPACYTGNYGSTTRNCTIKNEGHQINITTTQPLQPQASLTYVAGFTKGFFQPLKWYQKPFGKLLVDTLITSLPLIALSLIIWLIYGRDPRGSGVIVPQYDAPDGLTPLEVGSLIDFSVDRRDISATIIDLAIRGYLSIQETKVNKHLQKDKITYSLTLKVADYSALNPNETALLTGLFSELTVGQSISLDKSKTALYDVFVNLRKNVENSMMVNGYFRNRPFFFDYSSGQALRNVMTFIIHAGAFAGVGLFVAFGFNAIGAGFGIGLAIGFLISLPFVIGLDSRTQKGVTAKEHALGLKMYLEITDKDRLAKLQAPGAAYATDSAEPVRTVQLFEKLLPYAIVLGVEKEWSKQFEDLYRQPPSWYTGNWTTFSLVYLAGNLNNGLNTAVNTAFSSPQSSGGSGFGGGGFAGGGGGGGGGGGW